MYFKKQLSVGAFIARFGAVLFTLVLLLVKPSQSMAQSTTAISNASINYTACTEDQNKSILTSTEAKETSTDEKFVAAPIMPSVPGVKPPSLNADYLFNLINDHRKQMNLPAFEKNDDLCKIAVSRGPAIYNEVFVTHNIHAGFNALNLPYWATENMKYGGSETDILNWWLNSPLHRRAIEGDYKYSCGECYGNGCIQLFTNFQAK